MPEIQNMVMLHTKLKEMKHTIIYWQICCPYTHSRPLGGVIFFSKISHVAYQDKANDLQTLNYT